MRTFQEIKDNYRFTDLDAETLKGLGPIVEPHAERIISDFFNLFLQFPDTARFLQDEPRATRLQALHRQWLTALFHGPYDERYFQRLQRIAHAHVRAGVSAHFVHVGMNLIRQRLRQIVTTEADLRDREAALLTVDKMLDLNLDVIGRTYHEEEIRKVFLSQRFDSFLIRVSQRFTFGLNILLVIGLLGLSLGAVALIVQDVATIVMGQFDRGLIGALGSVLVLWVVIELLDMEIDRLQGGDFKLNLFVGVALVAFIRKVLVASLSHQDLKTEGLYLAGILVCGVIYWLVSRAEGGKNKRKV